MTRKPAAKTRQILAGAAVLALSLLVSLVFAEMVLRLTILEDREYRDEAVRFVMRHLQADPEAGFLWQGNLAVPAEQRPAWQDTETMPLTTDAAGFFNTPEAIKKRRTATPDIIGLGDSFMHNGAYALYEYFKTRGLFYYNMAMSRHCPPQYNAILKRNALPLKPRIILYGVYENDFREVADFEAWQRSGTDWFTYHSGTWFGAPVQPPGWRILFEKYAPGFSTLEKRIRRRFGLGPPRYQKVNLGGGTKKERAEKVTAYIEQAYRETTGAGISFLCLLIPVRDVNGAGASPHDVLYDIVFRELNARNIPVLDLRPVFNDQADRAGLYYRRDAHWNRTGMRVAAEAIAERLKPYLDP